MEELNTQIDYTGDFEALRASVGAEIGKIWRDQYYFNDRAVQEEEGSLAFCFRNGQHLTLSLATDGESVRASSEQHELPTSFWMSDEDHCSWQEVVLADKPEWSKLKGSAIQQVKALVCEWTDLKGHPETLVEWQLEISTGDRISYLNSDDTSVILLNESFPINDVEYIRPYWITICKDERAV